MRRHALLCRGSMELKIEKAFVATAAQEPLSSRVGLGQARSKAAVSFPSSAAPLRHNSVPD